MSFYSVSPVEAEAFGVVRAPDDFELPDLTLEEVRRTWKAPRLTLHEGGWADGHGGNLTRILYSQRFRDVVEQHRGPRDAVVWVPFEVEGKGEVRPYYLPLFPAPMDILDRQRSILVDDFVVKAVLDRRKVEGRQVLALEPDSDRFFLSDAIVRVLQADGAQGLEFDTVPMR